MKLRKEEIDRTEEKGEEELSMARKKSKDKKKKRDRKKKKDRQYSTTPTATPKDISGDEPMSTDDVCQTTPSKSNFNGNEVLQESKEVRIPVFLLVLVDKAH